MANWLNAWIAFLFGTPKRCLWTAGVVFIGYVAFVDPNAPEYLAGRIMTALMPLVAPVVAIAVLVLVARGFLGKTGSSSSSKKH